MLPQRNFRYSKQTMTAIPQLQKTRERTAFNQALNKMPLHTYIFEIFVSSLVAIYWEVMEFA
ncbi:hypothetical protein ACQP3D_29970, partial [Escherichia coli]